MKAVISLHSCNNRAEIYVISIRTPDSKLSGFSKPAFYTPKKKGEYIMDNKHNEQFPPAAFCSATNFKAADHKGDSKPETETESIATDLIVIRKSPDVCINNEIGKIFKGHNLIECKSPGDQTGESLLKPLGYVFLYIAHADNGSCINANDITISIVREQKPKKLIKKLTKQGLGIVESGKGIYYICGSLFSMQIIVFNELSSDEQNWIQSLTAEFEKEDAEKMVLRV